MTIPRANHPWKLLKRELEARNWTQKQLADLVDKTPAEVNDLISWKRNITIDRALRLQYALGMSHEIWIGIQNKRDAVQLLKQQEKLAFFQSIEERARELVLA